MHCEVAERLQNELAVRFHVSLQCVSCELKFFTGIKLNVAIEMADTVLSQCCVALSKYHRSCFQGTFCLPGYGVKSS